MGVTTRRTTSAGITDRVGHDLATTERISMLNWDGFDPTGANDSLSYLNAAVTQALVHGQGNERGVTLELPTGLIAITDTLHLDDGAFQYGGVGLVGQSRQTTHIQYTGSTDGRPAIMVDSQKGIEVGNFQLTRSGARGGSVGIAFGGDTGSGTQCISNIIRHIFVEGFNTGVYVGNYSSSGLRDGVAASELIFEFLEAGSCDYGMYFHNPNTLNIFVYKLNTNSCGYGAYINTAGAIWFGGGAGADNTIADFRFGGGNLAELRNWRTERANRLAMIVGCSVSMDNVQVADYKVSGHDGIGIEGSNNLTIKNSNLNNNGKITGSDGSEGAQLILINTYVGTAQYLYPDPGETGMNGSRVTAIESTLHNGAAVVKTGPLAVYLGQGDGTLKTVAQVTSAGNVLSAYSSKAGDPTTSDVLLGTESTWLNTSSGVLKRWANVAGVMKGVAYS